MTGKWTTGGQSFLTLPRVYLSKQFMHETSFGLYRHVRPREICEPLVVPSEFSIKSRSVLLKICHGLMVTYPLIA